MKEIIIGIGLSIVALVGIFAALFGLIAHEEEERERELKDDLTIYSELVANGETYDVDEIVEVDYKSYSHANDIITFTLKDGTKVCVQEGAYTLKK